MPALLRDAHGSSIPIMVISTESREEDRKRAAALGAEEYLVKPFHAAVMFLDVDCFKNVNITASHLVGDNVLRDIGATLSRLVHRYEGARDYRYGGDEFVVVMEGYSSDEGLALASSIRREIHALKIAETPVQITVSIGVAIGDSSVLELLLAKADAAVRSAKEKGRDRVEVFDPSEKTAAPNGTDLVVASDSCSATVPVTQPIRVRGFFIRRGFLEIALLMKSRLPLRTN